MIEEEDDDDKGVKLGLGDFIFYSILVGKVIMNADPDQRGKCEFGYGHSEILTIIKTPIKKGDAS